MHNPCETDIGIMFHKDYAIFRTYENICSNSVSEEKFKDYLNLEEKKNWLKNIEQSKILKKVRGMKR